MLAVASLALATTGRAPDPAQSLPGSLVPHQATLLASTRVLGGINVEPSMRPWRLKGANPDSWWCVAPSCEQNPNPLTSITTELALARNLGVRVVRVEFPWFLIEPQNGVYDFSRADTIVQAAGGAGIQLQPVLVYTPAWAGGSPNSPPRAGDWATFVKAMVARYPSIRYWEMWNEPDLSKYFAGSEQQYVDDILVPGFEASRSANPSAEVILGGPSGPNPNWANGIYSLGGGSSFDVMAFHDYGGSPAEDSVAMEAVLRAHGQPGKPLWLGEYGAEENRVNDTNQESIMTAVLTSASPLSMAIWYNLRDDFAMDSCCSASDIVVSGYWGLVQHNDVTLKHGYATMQGLLGGRDMSPSSPVPTAAAGVAVIPGLAAGRGARPHSNLPRLVLLALTALGIAGAAASVLLAPGDQGQAGLRLTWMERGGRPQAGWRGRRRARVLAAALVAVAVLAGLGAALIR